MTTTEPCTSAVSYDPARAEIRTVTEWPTNGHMIADMHRMGWIKDTDTVVDLTYGEGVFWSVYRPPNLIAHDLDPEKGDGVDWRATPEKTGTVDVVVFDGPYVCVDTETEILTGRGWLRYDTVTPGDEAYTLDHDTGSGEWQKIHDVILLPAAERQMLSMEAARHSSLTTLEHRWPVLRRRRSGAQRALQREWATSGSLLGDDRIPLRARASDLPEVPTYSDAFVEIVAWFWTEGTLRRNRDGRHSAYGRIVQSHVVNPDNCARIRAAFTAAYGAPVEQFQRVGRAHHRVVPAWRESVDGHKAVFTFSSAIGRDLGEAAPGKVPSIDFLRALTARQLELFIDASLAADGHRTAREGRETLGQKSRVAAETFQVACTLSGRSTSLRQQASGMWVVALRTDETFRAGQQHPEIVTHEGIVWCVRTPNRTWLARRRGTVYFTGNCPGGRSTSTIKDFHKRFGMQMLPKTPEETHDYLCTAFPEIVRVLRPKVLRHPDPALREGGYALVKCADYVWGGRYRRAVNALIDEAERHGLTLLDMAIFVDEPRAQPGCRTCKGDGVVGGQNLSATEEVPQRVCPTCGGNGRHPQSHLRSNCSNLLILRNDNLGTIRREGLFDE